MFRCGTVRNTAKLTGIGVSSGGSLTSASGWLVQQPDGSYGYRAAMRGRTRRRIAFA